MSFVPFSEHCIYCLHEIALGGGELCPARTGELRCEPYGRAVSAFVRGDSSQHREFPGFVQAEIRRADSKRWHQDVRSILLLHQCELEEFAALAHTSLVRSCILARAEQIGRLLRENPVA